jgi:hypothetical protein
VGQQLFLRLFSPHCKIVRSVVPVESRADNRTLRAASDGPPRLPDSMRSPSCVRRWFSTNGPTVVTIPLFPRGLESILLQENSRTA